MSALVLAPLLLVAVLVVSGLAKLRDDSWQPDAVTRMGVPSALAHPLLVKALPWAELALGALLFAPGRWSLVGAVPATLLMLGYVVVVIHALRTIAHPTCHCFGQLTEGEVTRITVARNVALTLVGLVAVGDALAGGGITSRVATFVVQEWAWLVGAVAVAAVLWLVVGQSGRPVEDVSVGGEVLTDDELLDYHRLPIPFGTLRDLDDRPHQLRDLPRRRAVLLFFLSEGCSACSQVIAELPDYQRRLNGLDLRPVLVAATAQAARDSGLVNPLFDPASETWRMFGGAVPMAVLLGVDGLLAAGPVMGNRGVSELIDDIEAELTAAEVASMDDANALEGARP